MTLYVYEVIKTERLNHKMTFQIFYSPLSKMSEKCLWLKEGKRYICITYEYIPLNGDVNYAASIFKLGNGQTEINEEQITAHEHTTTRRFEIRPVIGFLASQLGYYDMIKEIRYKMCFGMGCVGPRKDKILNDYGSISTLSSVESMSNCSDSSYFSTQSDKFEVSPRTYSLKTVKTFKYGHITYEPVGDASYTYRDIFVSYKGLSQNGDLLYGACISNCPAYDKFDTYHRVDEPSHFETSLRRLNKSPVHMSIPKEFRNQLKRESKHHEDIMYLIVDKIMKRENGMLIVKG